MLFKAAMFLLLLAGLAAGWSFITSPPAPDGGRAHQESNQSRVVTSESPGIQTILKVPLALSPNQNQDCRSLWNGLAAANSVTEQRSLLLRHRCSEANPGLQSTRRSLLNACATSEAQCNRWMRIYRALITEEVTKNLPLSAISDPQVLSQKLYASFRLSGAPDVEVAARLMEVDPTNPLAANAYILARVNQAGSNLSNGLDGETSQLDRAFEQMKLSSDHDPVELAEMRVTLGLLNQAFGTGLKSQIQELDQSYPNEGIGPYYQAWLAARNQNPEDAAAYLQEAIRREPSNERYLKALANLSGTSGGTPFDAAFGAAIKMDAGSLLTGASDN